MVRSKLKIALYTVLGLASSVLISLAVYQLVLPVVAWFVPCLESPFYDLGVYGPYRTQSYVSYNLSSPRLDHPVWDEQCDKGYVFLTPHGDSVENPGPMVLDASGELVWMSAEFGMVMNLALQEYKGQNYLTFWAGKKAGTFGAGAYYMVREYQSLTCVGQH